MHPGGFGRRFYHLKEGIVIMAKVFCPKCSSIANPLHRACTVGTATGITAGGATVIIGMVRGARAGSALGVAGTAIGAAAGAVLNLLWGITSGGLLGAQAGKLIDENVIGLYRCPKCHLRFKA